MRHLKPFLPSPLPATIYPVGTRQPLSSHLVRSGAPDRPGFDPTLYPEECALIREEQEILEAVVRELAALAPPGHSPDVAPDLLELRDSLADASRDDVAQIVAQMDGLAILSSQLGTEEERPFNLSSPYFGHLRLKQGGRVKDVLIGERTVIAPKFPYPITDWRNAPVSRLFYSYREGDEYEEEFAGKPVEGTVVAHRRLIILQGRLLRIDCPQGTFRLAGHDWIKVEGHPPRLHGGAGTAVRPGTVTPLGVGYDGIAGDDRRLPSITGLIDPAQFDLITRPDSGIVVIDGGAGSGKTTIALHRIAYLTFQEPERFRPAAILAVVFNKALAAYISRLLPALGVDGVRMEVFEHYVSSLRRRHFAQLAGEYSETTPFSVVRLKHHPAALAMLQERIADRTADFRAALEEALASTKFSEKALEAWDSLAEELLATRMTHLSHWVSGRSILPGVGGFDGDWLVRERMQGVLRAAFPDPAHPTSLALEIWQEGFIRSQPLRAAIERLAPGEFSTAQLKEVCGWCQKAYHQREEYAQWVAEGRPQSGAEEGEENANPSPPLLDREDDTLLLLLYRSLIGALRGRRRRALKFSHLMIDEAQDFGPLDLRLLIELAAEPRSVTLAGDTEQRMILHNAFDTWEEVLRNLGYEGTTVSPLEVGYRSTGQIMAFSRAVLGPLATERPWLATRSGAPVSLLRFTNHGQAVAVLSDALAELLRNEPSAYVALIARYPAQADLYYEGLVQTDLPRLHRVAEQDFTFQAGVEVTDIFQVKGLEFDYVVLLDVDRDSYPDDPASRYLLHIGATRAAHQLWAVSCGPPSSLLPDDMEAEIL